MRPSPALPPPPGSGARAVLLLRLPILLVPLVERPVARRRRRRIEVQIVDHAPYPLARMLRRWPAESGDGRADLQTFANGEAGAVGRRLQRRARGQTHRIKMQVKPGPALQRPVGASCGRDGRRACQARRCGRGAAAARSRIATRTTSSASSVTPTGMCSPHRNSRSGESSSTGVVTVLLLEVREKRWGGRDSNPRGRSLQLTPGTPARSAR